MIGAKKIVLDILKAFLNGNNHINVADSLDWNEFIRLTEINSVSGIIGYVLNQDQKIDCPDKIKQFYTEAYFSTIAITTIRDEAMKSVIELLSKNGIDHLLFKGYVVKDLYTVPELRTFGDIDFAIRLEDRAKCNELMQQNGFRLLDDWEPVYSYEYELEHYEVHTELLDSNLNERMDYKAYFSDFWNHAQKIDKHTYVLAPEYHLLYLLMHIAKHLYGSGAGIRMYLDIAFFIMHYREQIDWQHFQSEIEKLKLSDFVNTVFSAVDGWFEIRSPISLKSKGSDFLDKFTEFTLNGGVFGFVDKSSVVNQLRKNANERSINRLNTLLNRTFPPVKHMKARYTYLQTKPWLLPAAWVHRFFKKKGTTVGYIREGKELLTMNQDEVMVLNELYRQIGI